GHDDAPAAAPTEAAPRFALASELFELVGVVNGHTLALYLDRADDNRPVPGAQLELELAGQRLAVTPVGEGEYRAELAAPLAEGSLPVTATVVAGDDTDLLAGALDWHAPAAAVAPGGSPRMRWLAGAAGALAALGAALWVWRDRRRAAPQATVRAGGAA
ncbi:MAG: hypothetical protein J0H52_14710, partial [Comamonadaceae bacterium]|nr:hypothetical protein [Comamonadaceae bacterium]